MKDKEIIFMGFRENLINDWKDKTIEYQDRFFYIVDQFVYEEKEYLYGCNIDTLNNQNLEVVFLYKIKDDIFEHVEDNELFNNLFLYVAGKLTAEKIDELADKYNTQN